MKILMQDDRWIADYRLRLVYILIKSWNMFHGDELPSVYSRTKFWLVIMCWIRRVRHNVQFVLLRFMMLTLTSFGPNDQSLS